MYYKIINNKLVFRLEKGEELMNSIKTICEKENVKFASISGIGACSKLEMGYIVVSAKKYVMKEFEGNMEILHLSGNVSKLKGETLVHAHINIADEKYRSFGGHVTMATISATFEGVLHLIDHEFNRKFDSDIGINLLDI